jgi:hypothetical protein
MVLVEVVQLIVHVDWTFDVTCDFFKLNCAIFFFRSRQRSRLQVFLALLVILSRAFEYLFAEHVQNNTDSQKNDTENAEGEHGAHGSWNWPPGRQGLLLELRLLELLDLITDPLLFLLIDVHLFFLILSTKQYLSTNLYK